jgi:DNA-binding transcriptional ArsR family regulator
MKNENYYVVQGWMINELSLSGYDLQIYAIIHGFTQDGETWYIGGNGYLRELLKISRSTVSNSLQKLVNNGLLESQMDDNNDLSTKRYKSNQIDFLDDWKKARKLFLNVETHINKLTSYEQRDFNRLKTEFKKEDFKDGIKGLFKQKEIYKSVKLRPTHFLQERNIEKYIDAYRNNIQLFQSKKRENKL